MRKTTIFCLHRAIKLTFSLLLFAGLTGCEDPRPIVLGFVGGTSGKVADLGVAGRNGFILAVEQRNAAGGIQSKPIEIILKDDKQTESLAKTAVEELVAAKVDAIIGPMTSAMAIASVDIINQNKTLMMGATVTTNKLTNIDDYFFRTLSATRDHAAVTANFLRQEKGVRSFSAIYDIRNKAYTEDWLDDFTAAIEAQGASLKVRKSFESSNDLAFGKIADALLVEPADVVVMVVNSVDAALLAKHIRQRNPQQMLATSEWAGTERLVELGGSYVDGTIVPQYLDRDSQDSDYLKFRSEFLQRFKQEPGFPGLVAYNATNVVLNALEKTTTKGGLKDTLLSIRTFKGIGGDITFSPTGDASTKTYITQIVDGKFRLQK
ncbi:MAG: ABC transporter substrate-binding protein [Hahellaceae bacterium]|nr:ABC transporter substrate-binding protein [Hahellaceae bacterium]MCP5212299.1 ABC transporter substrate-binding protein [Hahellaceae bacterium]